MVLAIAFAHVWGTIQLIILGSFARTVRMRTVLAAFAVGVYAIGPLTVLLQLGWIHLAASLTGTPVAHLTSIASYSVDPFLEEALKLLPLAMLLLLIPVSRSQWSVTDCVLIAAATGSGYGLAEDLYRYAGFPHAAYAVAGGWAISRANTTVLVPGVVRSLTSWLPAGAVWVEESIRWSPHLVWSAIGGLAVGLLLRYRTRNVRIVAAGLLLYIGLDHATGNAALHRDTWLGHLGPVLHALATEGGLLVLVALAVAGWLDQRTPHSGVALEPLLAAERAASSRLAGTLKAGMSRLPWSIVWVGGFARTRRAYHAAKAVAPAGPDRLLAAVVAQRDQVDRDLIASKSPSLLPSGLTPTALRNALRRRAVIVTLVCLAPSILYLVIGGFPETAGVQAVMKGPIVWPLVLLITIVAQGRLAWSVIVGVRNWSKTRRLSSVDDAAIAGLQLACGIGAVGLAGVAMIRVFGGVSAGSSLISGAHGAEAANRVTPEDAAAVANSAAAAGEAVADDVEAEDYGAETDGDVANPVIHAGTGTASLGTEAGAGMDANTESDAAADAEARAAQAEADALDAQKFRQQALDALQAAENDRGGPDPELDAARAREAQAHEAAAQAGNDDALNQDAKDAMDAYQKALNDRWARESADVEDARNAVSVAENGVNEANARAAEARQAADRAADPLGAAASDADKNYLAAQARESQAFVNPDPHSDYAAVQKETALAREQAEAAHAAVEAAKDARAARDPWDKP